MPDVKSAKARGAELDQTVSELILTEATLLRSPDGAGTAISQTLADPERAEQVSMDAEGQRQNYSWGILIIYRQCETLNLSSECPPCWIDDPDETLGGPNDVAWLYGAHAVARLLKRMLAVVVSRYHLDPLKAIADAKQR